MTAANRRRITTVIWTIMLWLMTAEASVGQTLGQRTDVGIAWWRLILGLVVCIGLAIAAAYVLRNRLTGLPILSAAFLRNRGPRRLVLVETTRLSQQVDVCLLRYDGRELLIAVSAQGAVMLTDGDRVIADATDAA